MVGSIGFRNGDLVTKNITFDYTTDPQPGQPGIITADAQLLIGSVTTTPNIAMTAGNIIADTGITVTYLYPNIKIGLTGGAVAIEKVALDIGTSPIVPTGGQITLTGSIVAAGTNPIRTDGTGPNTARIEVQTSQALAAADSTKIGLSNFDSSSFAVAATGFVTLSTTGSGKTITGDSGGALSPTANNWNILGLSGSKTSGSSSTLTIKSPPFSQVGASATSALNSGEFVTAAVTRTLPASAGLADGDLFIYVCTTAGALVIQSVTAQKIRLGNVITSAAGTATSTAIGDSLTLRFNATDGFFYAVSSIGNWTLSP